MPRPPTTPTPASSPSDSDSTRESLLAAARELAQTRGYNAFSFRDLSDQIGVKTASIHYYFPTKADLGREIVIRYRQDIAEHARQIEVKTSDPTERLERFCDVLRASIKKGTRMCLCGMFGAEYMTLPSPVQEEVRLLFDTCESWLASILKAGRTAGTLHFKGDPRRAAQGLFASLQGGLMSACAFQDESRYLAAADAALASFSRARP